MITPDTIPFWPAILGFVIFSAWWLILEFIHAPLDPNPEYSRLDLLDGLPHD